MPRSPLEPKEPCGVAVQMLCSKWNIPLSEAVAFGDNYNDVEMLEIVGNGILIGNAPDKLKKRIKKQTEDNNHDGIYNGLLKIKLIDLLTKVK